MPLAPEIFFIVNPPSPGAGGPEVPWISVRIKQGMRGSVIWLLWFILPVLHRFF